jgi:hypothetical protein
VFEYNGQRSCSGTVSGIKCVTVWYFTYDEEGHLVDRGSATDVIYPCIDSPNLDDVLYEEWDHYGLTTSYTFLDDRYGFGAGWSLSLPTFEYDSGVIFLHMDGQT